MQNRPMCNEDAPRPLSILSRLGTISYGDPSCLGLSSLLLIRLWPKFRKKATEGLERDEIPQIRNDRGGGAQRAGLV
jgi:hypothetical protein